MLQEYIGNNLVTEIMMMTDAEFSFFLNLCGGEFFPKFRKQLNDVKINTNHEQHKPNTPVAIKAAVAIWPEEKQLMAEMYAHSRGMYINIMTRNDRKEEEYEKEMRKTI